MTADDAAPRRTLYGRRKGPRLRPNDRARLAEALPERRLVLPAAADRLSAAELLLPGTHALWLEIGFGNGDHLVAQMHGHPDVTHLGVEPYLNGVASLLRRAEAMGLTNVRLLVDDARLLLDVLPDGSLERIAVLFPDPWPKARHHKRRIVNRTTVSAFARLLRPGGELRLATDHGGYATWMIEALSAEPRLQWCAERARDWQNRPKDWPPTRYEAKALAAGARPIFLRYRRAGSETACARACKAKVTSPLSKNK